MTKNYALFLLNQLCVGASVDAKPIIPQFELAQALNVAIKALGQQPCEDCISRQAVLDGLASIAKAKARSDAQKSLMGRVMFFTEQLPPVTPKAERKYVLDKIRAEIMSKDGLEEALEIIDKYKAESEKEE